MVLNIKPKKIFINIYTMWHRAATLDQQPRLLTRSLQCPGPAIFMLRYRDTKLIIYIVHCNPDRALAEAMRFNLSLFLWLSAVRAPEVFAMLKVQLWAPTLQSYFSSCCRWLHAVIMFPVSRSTWRTRDIGPGGIRVRTQAPSVFSPCGARVTVAPLLPPCSVLMKLCAVLVSMVVM